MPDIWQVLVCCDISSSFVNENHPGYENAYGKNCLQTLSVLDLSKMDAVTSAINDFVTLFGTNQVSYEAADVAFRSSYNSFGDKLYGLCDLNSFLDHLAFFPVQKEAIKDAVSDLVVVNNYCSNYSITPCGLNAFFPVSLSKKYPLQVMEDDYMDVGGYEATKFKGWQDMCLNFGKFF